MHDEEASEEVRLLAEEAEDRVAYILCEDDCWWRNGADSPCDIHRLYAWRIMDTIPARFIVEPESVGFPMTPEEFLAVARVFQESWPISTWEDVKRRLDS